MHSGSQQTPSPQTSDPDYTSIWATSLEKDGEASTHAKAVAQVVTGNNGSTSKEYATSASNSKGE